MIKKAFDIAVDIILIILLMILIARIIVEIKTMVELEYPGDCIKINNTYYCKQRNDSKEKSKGITM